VKRPSPPVELQPVNVRPPAGIVPLPSELSDPAKDDDEQVSTRPLLDWCHSKFAEMPVNEPLGETVKAVAA